VGKKRIAVTGIGAVSAAGRGVEALANGLDKAERVFTPSCKHEVDFDVTVGEAGVDCFEDHDHEELDSPTGRLCLSAARECVSNGLSGGAGAPDGLVLGTSTGGQSKNEEAVFAVLSGEEPPTFNYRAQGCMAAPARLVSRDLNIVGPQQTVSTACTSSANAIALGALWISSGRCRRVLAGGGDALCYTTISSFHILDLTGPEMCRPFGSDRPGLTLGEGAGFLLLEPMDDVLDSGRRPLAELCGFGMSSDAHHMTAPPEDGRGAEQAMRQALEMAGLHPDDAMYVNAHGTGTRLNDASEASAINRLFGDRVPVMSCKGLVGHTLGGAGGIEAVVSVISIQKQHLFENIGTAAAADDCPVSIVPAGGLDIAEHSVVISNSFAFGGNNCSLVFGAFHKAD
jgi:3-oxoacyl-[acyl-carrier-protein] synthase-1